MVRIHVGQPIFRGKPLRGEYIRIRDLLSARTIIESLVGPFVMQHLAGTIRGLGHDRGLPAGYGLAFGVSGLAPDNLCFQPKMTSHHLAISVVAAVKTEQVEPAEWKPPIVGSVDRLNDNGRGYMLQEQHPRRGASESGPLDPA
jgi:hypothetical protein